MNEREEFTTIIPHTAARALGIGYPVSLRTPWVIVIIVEDDFKMGWHDIPL